MRRDATCSQQTIDLGSIAYDWGCPGIAMYYNRSPIELVPALQNHCLVITIPAHAMHDSVWIPPEEEEIRMTSVLRIDTHYNSGRHSLEMPLHNNTYFVSACVVISGVKESRRSALKKMQT